MIDSRALRSNRWSLGLTTCCDVRVPPGPKRDSLDTVWGGKRQIYLISCHIQFSRHTTSHTYLIAILNLTEVGSKVRVIGYCFLLPTCAAGAISEAPSSSELPHTTAVLPLL